MNLYLLFDINQLFNIIQLFGLFNWLYQSFNWLFHHLINFFDLLIEIDGNWIEIAIVNTISSSKSESERNWWLNLAGLESVSSMIWCRAPNCISLVFTCLFLLGWAVNSCPIFSLLFTLMTSYKSEGLPILKYKFFFVIVSQRLK